MSRNFVGKELDMESAVRYHYEGFPPSSLDYERLMEPVAKATDAIARYDQMLKYMHDNEVFLAPLRNQEAVISSRMEGTVSTMDEIFRYEADYDENDENPQVRMEVLETVLYNRALKNTQSALEAGEPLSPTVVRAAHENLLLLGRGAKKSPGQYKNEQNYLIDKTKRKILFVPISPEALRAGMDDLFEYIRTAEHPKLIKIAISHLEFEALHPFKDGNGRIGRMLITIMLWSMGVISRPHFYISAYFEEEKDRYIDSMRDVSRTGNWTPWCEFFLEAMAVQANRNLETAQKIRDLHNDLRPVFIDMLSSKWAGPALDFMFTNPVFRNSKFTKRAGIPSGTAAKFSKTLHDAGLLRLVDPASGQRAALYSFEPLMELVRV